MLSHINNTVQIPLHDTLAGNVVPDRIDEKKAYRPIRLSSYFKLFMYFSFLTRYLFDYMFTKCVASVIEQTGCFLLCCQCMLQMCLNTYEILDNDKPTIDFISVTKKT